MMATRDGDGAGVADATWLRPPKKLALKKANLAADAGAGAGEHIRGDPDRAAGLHRNRVPFYDTALRQRGLTSVAGQNSNNTVRVTDDFLKAVAQDGEWNLIRRTDGKVARSIKARDLWSQIGYAAWACADPGLQFDTTINAWHTCPQSGRINASNPCSEYMFLDDTACNLASLNLMTFRRRRQLHVAASPDAVRLWT
jgi:ribonucleoside-diphosphate reductase alpha chain